MTYLQGHEEKPGLSPDSQLYSSKFCLFQEVNEEKGLF